MILSTRVKYRLLYSLLMTYGIYVQNDSIDGTIEILNTELAKVTLWFDSTKLTLNVNVTKMKMLSPKIILTQ